VQLTKYLPPSFAFSTEVRSTFNLWSTLLAETRKMSRERANLAEVMASEMLARLEVMAKDVHILAKKVCVCVCSASPAAWGNTRLCVCSRNVNSVCVYLES